jgi:mono/diheme cytochrome c family protein
MVLKMSANLKYSLILLAGLALLVSCGNRETRELQYAPDMYVSPAIKPQEGDPDNPGHTAMRVPPEGTIPRNFEPYQIAITDTLAASKLVNPLPVDENILASGEKYFDIFCSVCHGKTGAGDGPIIPKMTKPPLLYSKKVIDWPDGRIYHTITYGQGNMPSYRNYVDPMTRWAIIHYIRTLQKSQNPSGADLAAKK